MRDTVRMILLIPILVFPLVVIASGGDLELLWTELQSLVQGTLVVTAQAGTGPSPTVTVGPSPGVTLSPGFATVPTLTRWGTIVASIVLALIGLLGIRLLGNKGAEDKQM